MCAEFDVTPRTLRYYEYIELLQPDKEARSRFYTAREIGRMKLIMRGRRFGFSLEEIRQWLEMYEPDSSDIQMEYWIERAERQLIELKKQSVELNSTITELEDLKNESVKSLT
ncbi:MAG: MerR family DNA-binding transcriptional regulator [Paracoccaceae bacterium]